MCQIQGAARAEAMNWLFWQMANQGPACGTFGHFFVYAPEEQNQTRDYCAARFGMEVQRQCDVLNRHLKGMLLLSAMI